MRSIKPALAPHEQYETNYGYCVTECPRMAGCTIIKSLADVAIWHRDYPATPDKSYTSSGNFTADGIDPKLLDTMSRDQNERPEVNSLMLRLIGIQTRCVELNKRADAAQTIAVKHIEQSPAQSIIWPKRK